jgi:hypothetical protein
MSLNWFFRPVLLRGFCLGVRQLAAARLRVPRFRFPVLRLENFEYKISREAGNGKPETGNGEPVNDTRQMHLR